MKIRYNPIATKAFAEAPAQIQKAFLKQAAFLVQNLHHPSLHAKKYDEARVDKAFIVEVGQPSLRVPTSLLRRSIVWDQERPGGLENAFTFDCKNGRIGPVPQHEIEKSIGIV